MARMPEFSSSMSTNGFSIDYTTHVHFLKPRPEIDTGGNINHNALKYLFEQKKDRKHVTYQRQL